ncbi:MAG: isopentenyl-diphosphate Delta-isomerase [Planctomycetota bacterium]
MQDLWGSRADELLVLVDENDVRTGVATRAECHALDGLCHRAFSVYLFDDADRLLVHQRQSGKPLWPDFWSNSCCSHPIDGEETHDAALRRVREELGVDVDVRPVHRYEYRATFGDVGTEHEVVTVFLGSVDPEALQPDPDEVAAIEFMDAETLDATIGDEARFTPWFRLAWPVVRDAWRDRDRA